MSLKPDGLATPEVHSWAQDKYSLVQNYADLFATSMKYKWDKRVYVDLFAGAGRARIKETRKIVLGSPLLALEVTDPYDNYIFCEMDDNNAKALETRIKANYSSKKIDVLHGNANRLVPEILSAMPSYGKDLKVLAFCFADPFKLKNLEFNTIKGLADRFVDFLILLPTDMDARRNWKQYEKPQDQTVDIFLGHSNWRPEWQQAKTKNQTFDLFLTQMYERQMQNLGYVYGGTEDSVHIRSTDKNLPLYRLCFFSRHAKGGEFWKETRKYSKKQRDLF